MAKKYQEIIKLHKYCVKIGVPATLEELFDGYAIRFTNRWGDFVQHMWSYGAECGYVEPAIGCKLDYTAVTLKQAKDLVRRHKEKLIGGALNGT